MRVAIVNYVWDADLDSPDALLDRFFTLTGWAGAVRDAGAEPIVFQRFSANADVERHGVTYRFCADHGPAHPPRRFTRAAPLHDAIASARPDVVHVNSVLHPSLVRALRAILPATSRLVVQDHGGVNPATAPVLARRAIRRGLDATDGLVLAAAGQEDAWRRAAMLPDHVRVFDVMEGSTTFSPRSRDEARRGGGVSGSPALLWVGRLTVNKDPQTVLRGFEAFAVRHPDARLTMVYGTGELEHAVRQSVVSSRVLSARVQVAGRVPHERLPAFYSAADMFVLGSHYEGSGYAAIEAMACSALPILTDIPSFRSLTGGGRAGELWPPGDADGLVRALERGLARVSDASRRAVRDHFEQSFSWQAIGRRAVEVYHLVASGAGL